MSFSEHPKYCHLNSVDLVNISTQLKQVDLVDMLLTLSIVNMSSLLETICRCIHGTGVTCQPVDTVQKKDHNSARLGFNES